MKLDNIYAIDTCVADVLDIHGPANVYTSLESFYAAQAKTKDLMETDGIERKIHDKPLFGFRIVNTYTGRVPAACRPFHRTIEEAMADYNDNILGIPGKGADTHSGTRKPTLFEEVKNFDLEQMSVFTKVLSDGNIDVLHRAFLEAKAVSYDQDKPIDNYGKFLSQTDESADPGMPATPPVIDGTKSFSVLLPEGSLTASECTDTDGDCGIDIMLLDRQKEKIGTVRIGRNDGTGIVTVHVTAKDQNGGKTVLTTYLMKEPDMPHGIFKEDAKQVLNLRLLDIADILRSDGTIPADTSFAVEDFEEKTIRITSMRNSMPDTVSPCNIKLAWRNAVDDLSVYAEFASTDSGPAHILHDVCTLRENERWTDFLIDWISNVRTRMDEIGNTEPNR